MSVTFAQPDESHAAAMHEPSEMRWYAVYTMAKHEKHVAAQLQHKSIECFTPEYSVVHRWKDRAKKLRAPLFPCYTFVHMPITKRLEVLTTAGVISIVGMHHIAIPLPDSEIEALRTATSFPSVLPHPYGVAVGDRVRMKRGPLMGMEGVVIRANNNLRLIVAVETIMRSISIEVQNDDVEFCPSWHN